MRKIYRQLLTLFLAAVIIAGGGIIVNSRMSQASGEKSKMRQQV